MVGNRLMGKGRCGKGAVEEQHLGEHALGHKILVCVRYERWWLKSNISVNMLLDSDAPTDKKDQVVLERNFSDNMVFDIISFSGSELEVQS